MQLTLNCVPFKSMDHGGEPVLEVKVDQFLFVFLLYLHLAHVVSHFEESSSQPMSLFGFGGAGNVVDSSLQLGHDDLILSHHVDGFKMANLLPAQVTKVTITS